ncbi:hypothetical protein GJAV_G00270150 [Gymnothorax javanicus]|nr:hypothetical protein GJAV_G00270150 [Gymnothorax javanicus]
MTIALLRLGVRPSVLRLVMGALLGLGLVGASRVPLPQMSLDVDNVTLGTASSRPFQRAGGNGIDLNSILPEGHTHPSHSHSTLSYRGRPKLRQAGSNTPNSSAPSLTPPQVRDGAHPDLRKRSRRKRSLAVDSSDPLCLHSPRGKCSAVQKQEEQPPEPEPEPSVDQSHAVSKETITSTSDDPFNVVQPPEGAASPRSVAPDKALTKKRTAAEEAEQTTAPL